MRKLAVGTDGHDERLILRSYATLNSQKHLKFRWIAAATTRRVQCIRNSI